MYTAPASFLGLRLGYIVCVTEDRQYTVVDISKQPSGHTFTHKCDEETEMQSFCTDAIL